MGNPDLTIMRTGSIVAVHLRTRRVFFLAALIALAVPVVPAVAKGHHPGRHHHHRRHHDRRHRRRAVATGACQNSNAPVGAVSRQATKAAVVCLINKERAAHGLPALHESSLLDRSAQGWTNVMVATGGFTHGSNFAERISAVGFRWSSAGENIATGFSTPRTVVNAWMGSMGHCENILNPTFSSVGTGVLDHPVGGFGSGGATWTQDFALAAGHRAPSGNSGPMSGCPY